MSGIQRLWNYCRENPVAIYIGGGVFVHALRTFSVNRAYAEHFAKFDVERQRELEAYLASHPKQ
jgi:cell wall-associated NlpC family hydrolase